MIIEKDLIFKLIEKNWPMHISEIADRLQIMPGNEAEREKIFQMIADQLSELANEQKIVMRNFGELKVVWPAEIKKLIK